MINAEQFRCLALALDGTNEVPHFDRIAFRVRRSFATLAPDGCTANLKFSPDEQALKCAVAPDAFVPVANAWGRQGWTTVILAYLSEAEARAALDMAWRHAVATTKRRKR